jgi:hypothetical protein
MRPWLAPLLLAPSWWRLWVSCAHALRGVPRPKPMSFPTSLSLACARHAHPQQLADAIPQLPRKAPVPVLTRPSATNGGGVPGGKPVPEPSEPSPNRLVLALAWLNALGLTQPPVTVRNLAASFKTGVLLCNLLERVMRPKPTFAVHLRPLARRMAIDNLEMVRRLLVCLPPPLLCLRPSTPPPTPP